MFSDIRYNDLTDMQRTFIEETTSKGEFKNVFLTGCAGSGKTIVAALTAKEYERQQKDVQFLSYTKFLRKYVEDHFVNQGSSIRANNFHRWAYIEEDSKCALAIVDECQDFTKDMVDDLLKKSQFQIWLGDINQQIYGQAIASNGIDGIYRGISDKKSDRYHFNINFRNPMAVAQLAKCFIHYDKKYDKGVSSLEEKIKNFINPILDNPLQSAANRNQPNTIIKARNHVEEFDAIVEKIKLIQSNDRGNKQIAIVGADHDICDEIENELLARNVDYTRYWSLRPNESKPDHINFTDPNLVLVSPITSLKGFEADYIIYPRTEKSNFDFNKLFVKENSDIYGDPYNLSPKERKVFILNLLFMLFSRAKKRVICSYTNENDSIVFEHIKDAMNHSSTKKYFIKQSAADVIGGDKNNPTIPETEVDDRISEVKSEFERNFPFSKSPERADKYSRYETTLKNVGREELILDEEDDLPF